MAADLLLSIDEARRLVGDATAPLDSEEVSLAQALDRVLAEDVIAAGDVPSFANSAMDGFAVAAGPAERRLQIVGESRAGAPSPVPVGPDQAVRISTGAVLPPGADAVIPLEQATEDDGWVLLHATADRGVHVREAGEDMRAGARVLAAGATLGPAELGVAVAAGRAQVRCGRRPRVAIVASGDELRAPGASLGPGEIHNSNAITLAALTRRAGAQPHVLDAVPDRPRAIRAALAGALEQADVVVVSGGVSVGPHDHVKEVLTALGVRERFWRVALRPGKPTWFGVHERALVFALPGNPVSTMVTFLLFVAPALSALAGGPFAVGRRAATLAAALPRRPDRDEAVRVALVDEDGDLRARPTGPQGSHVLTSMLSADGLLIVPAGEGELARGARVQVELI